MELRNEEAILNFIFNPSSGVATLNPPLEPSQISQPAFSEQEQKARALEHQAVLQAEGGNLVAALQLLTEAISLAPSWPSSYNNRAQVYRLKDSLDEALLDLNKCIDLCTAQLSSASSVDEAKKQVVLRTLRQAYPQRGYVRKTKGDVKGAEEDFSKLGDLAPHNYYSKLCSEAVSEMMQNCMKKERL
eukprot:TRINITY_DN9451_c0_g1_i1.p1 TRINITY_DN9451_c0_g1~~TRINITY_DN9451_c0_g1_i1.p1  ORF type:complete len:188 (-),score=33.38 TRINITY_DN9451_c0_g1_i1:58-621(-)